ncbi:type IV toxin-antitoxin system AbiEi family antitoxin domain-containing protein [Nocardioides sp.]|uniref:type IV toxin-antitoxin system AbiEi family antitoxin domain-containing protein n=1 Tax=Nocardioides sp. TaxID=35761 RepID=UPI00286DE8DF|nr:type IV toxin-antitoxin system AbiEi family antitoxin domain-containing protein [Nocardioides sp.]
MDTRIIARIAEGGGLARARDLRAAGVDPRAITALVRGGELVAVRRGIYSTAELWDAADEWRERPLARIRAAHLAVTMDHVFSHDSAAVLHGLPLIDVRESEVHVTRVGVVGSHTRYAVRHHGAPYAAEEVVPLGHLEALAVPRTVADLARTHGYAAGLVAADAALRLGHSRASLREATESMRCWPGVSICRVVIDDADRGAESAPETLGRVLVKELGVGDVETQFPIRTSSGVRWADMRIGCHLFEVDGRIKVTAQGEGGVATEPAGDVIWREKKRERDVTSRGLGVSRIVWQDFWDPYRARARARLRAEFDATCQRYGEQLPAELVEDARRIREEFRHQAG